MKKNQLKQQKIVLLGEYPPPPGGINVHIQRLQKKLQNEKIYCDVVDLNGVGDDISSNLGNVFRIGGFPPLTLLRALMLIWRLDPRILHVHISAFRNFSMVALFINLAVRKHTRLAITIHSGSAKQVFIDMNLVRKMMVRKALRRYDKIVTVNKDQKAFLGTQGLSHKKMTVIPAFLPPDQHTEYEELEQSLTPLRQDGRKLICTSGNGIRLYGFDKIIDAFTESNLSRKCSLVVCVYDKMDDVYMNEVRTVLGQMPNSLLLTDLDADQFGYVLANSDVYVRATDRDGDAVAIREANMHGLPVVASTVVERPEYCYLFELGNSQDLANKIENAVDETANEAKGQDSCNQNYEQIKSFLQIT